MGAIQQPVYGASVPALPDCAELLVMVKQSQTAGGVSVGDGMAQSGAAIAAKTAFLAALQSSVAANFNHVASSGSIEYHDTNPLSLWSGLGELRGKGTSSDTNMNVGGGGVFDVGNGRFNTSANVAGNWYVTTRGWDVTLTSTRTAFGCFVTDLGDVQEAEVEFRLYNGSTLVRTIAPPIVFAAKPRTAEGMWIGYANGNTPFDRIECELRQHDNDPDFLDYVGFDDLTVGEVVTCTASSTPVVHYGANTEADAAKTVIGAALTARNAFAAAASGLQVCDFESMTVGPVGPAAAISFGGGVTGTISGNQYNSTHTTISASTTDVIANSGASLRWNTTSGGSKWYEFTDEVVIQLSAAVNAVGFYITDLGNQNATLRVTLRRADGTGVAYYLPKAAALPGAASLLRFWGVTGEVQFTQVILQTVYYTTLTAGEYENPVFHVKGTPDMVGIDDLLIGN